MKPACCRYRTFAFGLAILLSLFILLSPNSTADSQAAAQPTGSQTQTDKEARLLELGKPTEGKFVQGEAHFYQITMTAGQFLNLVVDRCNIDMSITLSGPDGTKIVDRGNTGRRNVIMLITPESTDKTHAKLSADNFSIASFQTFL